MLVTVHQHNIAHSDALEAHANAVVAPLALRYMGRIARLDIYIEDVNGAKKGENDQRCLMEAHIAGLRSVVADARGQDPYAVVSDAAAALERAIEHRIGRAGLRT